MRTDKNFVDPVAYLRMNRYQFPSREGSLFDLNIGLRGRGLEDFSIVTIKFT